jgi:hypothetical protein
MYLDRRNVTDSWIKLRRGIHNFRNWCCHLYSGCSSSMQRWRIVLAYLGSQCTKFHAAGWTCWFFMLSHLESCILPDPGKSTTETLAMIRQAFGEESMSRTLVMACSVEGRLKKETGEKQSQGHSRHSLWQQGDCSQRICPGRPNSQFRILLWHFTATAWKCAKTLSTKLPIYKSTRYFVDFWCRTRILNSRYCPDRFWGSPSLLTKVRLQVAFIQGIKLLGRKAEYSPLTSGEVTNTRICTSTSPYDVMAHCLINWELGQIWHNISQGALKTACSALFYSSLTLLLFPSCCLHIRTHFFYICYNLRLFLDQRFSTLTFYLALLSFISCSWNGMSLAGASLSRTECIIGQNNYIH